MKPKRFRISERSQVLLLFGGIVLVVLGFWFFGLRDIQQKRLHNQQAQTRNQQLRETLAQSDYAKLDPQALADAIRQQTHIDAQLIKDWNTIHQRIALPMPPEAYERLKDITPDERYEIIRDQIQQTFQKYVDTGRILSFRNLTLNPPIPHLHNETRELLFEEYALGVDCTLVPSKLYDFISTDTDGDFFFIYNSIRITPSFAQQPFVLNLSITLSVLVFDYLYEE